MAPQDTRKPQTANDSLERSLLDGRGAFMGFLVKRLGNRADAEDVLQEFCIRVLARKDQLRDVERMDAWLYAILRSTLNDHYRKGARRSRLTLHCGDCCRDERGDCSCPPVGCKNPEQDINCQIKEQAS